jgi:GDP-4-dehydro-6-deoxy-D-mannose reductase
LQHGATVCGLDRRFWKQPSHFKHQVEFLQNDLTDPEATVETLRQTSPDAIIHLAAMAQVAASFHSPRDFMVTNVLSSMNLFEAASRLGFSGPLVNVCSGDEYGMVNPDELPIRESTLLRPVTPYAVSKAAQDLLGYQYGCTHNLKIITTRAFNHTGPRQLDGFVISSFAKQIALIEKHLAEPQLQVGNLNPKRDFSDVRDIVEGYWLALEKGVPGEIYNLSSGQAYGIGQLLEMLTSLSSITINVRVDPSRVRRMDVPLIIGDSTKFRKATQWYQKYSIETTLRDTLEYWRVAVYDRE